MISSVILNPNENGAQPVVAKVFGKNMKTTLLIIWILLSSGAAFGSSLLKVKTGETHQWREFLNVHESPISWLSVGGKKYMYAMGMDPCYLNIPGRDQILFITSNERQTEYIYHFVSLKDGRNIAMTVRDTGRPKGVRPKHVNILPKQPIPQPYSVFQG